MDGTFSKSLPFPVFWNSGRVSSGTLKTFVTRFPSQPVLLAPPPKSRTSQTSGAVSRVSPTGLVWGGASQSTGPNPLGSQGPDRMLSPSLVQHLPMAPTFLRANLPRLQPTSPQAIGQEPSDPWLFAPGPLYLLQFLNHQPHFQVISSSLTTPPYKAPVLISPFPAPFLVGTPTPYPACGSLPLPCQEGGDAVSLLLGVLGG